MTITGGTGRWCSPQVPASGRFHSKNRGNRTLLSASRSQSRCRSPTPRSSPPGSRSWGATPVPPDFARGLGSCSPKQSTGPQARGARTPGPGGRRGAAEGGGVAAGPLNLQGRSEGRSPGGATRGPDTLLQPQGAPRRCVLGPLFPRTFQGSPEKARAPGPGTRRLRAPGVHAGGGRAGLPAWSRPFPGRGGRVVACVWPPLYRGWTHPGLSLAWPFDRPNCSHGSMAPSPALRRGRVTPCPYVRRRLSP